MALTRKPGEQVGRERALPKGRYRLHERFGTDAYGEVWRAEDLKLGTNVAVKFFHRGAEALKLLRAKGALRAPEHKNILRVTDLNEEEGFTVSDHVDAKSLHAVLQDHAAGGTWLTREQAMQIFEQCLEALECAHEARCLHGDIRPANILVPNHGEAKLGNFGIALALADGTGGSAPLSSGTDRAGGSLTFADPELLEGGWEKAGARPDLFSLGCLAYLLFTARHPFLDPSGLLSPGHLMRNRAYVPPPPASLPGSRTDEATSAVIMRLLERRDETQMFPSARAVLDRLFPAATPTVQCANCGRDNPLGSKFCNNCAQELAGALAVEAPAPPTAMEVVEQEPRRSAGGARQTAEMMKLLFHSLEKLRAEPAARALTLVAFLLNTEHKYQRAANVATEAINLNAKLVEGYR
ncbi:MAG: serine/threonine-protein kinase, partial [Gemmatimonadales bacterium]